MKKITFLLIATFICSLVLGQSANYIPKLTGSTTFNNSIIYQTAGNRIGIGTISPYLDFHVVGNSVFTENTSGITSSAYIRGLNNYSTALTPDYTWYNNDQTGIFHPSNNAIGFSIGGQEKMRVLSSGINVIGNSIFSANTGTITSSAYIRGLNNYSTALTPDYTWLGNDQTGIFHPSANVIGFTTGGAERMRIANGGNVGINGDPSIGRFTICQNGSLTDAAGSTIPLMIWSGSETGALRFSVGVDKTNNCAYLQPARAWQDYNANLILNYLGNGGVGIGTKNATHLANYKLAVKGKIYCEGVDIVTTVPQADYVFEDDYKLQTLNEVENFIKANKHLPNIPSAKEFQENGYNIVDMDEKLLRKVEEIMLYLFQFKDINDSQNKIIEEQNKKIEQLENELKNLKK